MGRDVAEPGVDARDSAHFDPEIVLVPVPAHEDTGKDGDEIDAPDRLVTKDDGPRAGTTMEVLGKLKPAFRPDGTVTAGNACPLNDGTAAVLVMSAGRSSSTSRRRRGSSLRRSPRSGRRSWASDRSRRSRRCSSRPASRSTTSTWSRSTGRSRRSLGQAMLIERLN